MNKLTKIQRRTLKRICHVCETDDMCFLGPRVTRSVANALVKKGMIIDVHQYRIGGAHRIGYMMLEAGYRALGIEILDRMLGEVSDEN